MTFKPSEDVIDQLNEGTQTYPSMDQNFASTTAAEEGQHLFHASEGVENINTDYSESMTSPDTASLIESMAETVEAVDLSDLLKEDSTSNETTNSEVSVNSAVEEPTPVVTNTSEVVDSTATITPSVEENATVATNTGNTNTIVQPNTNAQGSEKVETVEDVLVDGSLSDEARIGFVSLIDGASHSSLDLLVDDTRYNIILQYKKIHRILFRWGTFALFAIGGIVTGYLFQANAAESGYHTLITDSVIENKSARRTEKPEVILDDLIATGVDIKPIISYGSMNVDNDNSVFQTKNNLVLYNDIVLPQIASVNYNEDLISMSGFLAGETSREDISQIVEKLITSPSLYKDTNKLPDADSMKRSGQTIEGGLIEGFNLSCLDKVKASNLICDRFLDTFMIYGKYYDLSLYHEDLEKIMSTLKSQKKSSELQNVCDMIMEHTWRAGDISQDLGTLVTQYCSVDEKEYSKTRLFIELEISLRQLSDTVYNDQDINAYKLLSAMQQVYNKNLEGTNLDIDFIKNYFDFIQALVDKDNGTNKYIGPIYKDIVYVFNEDVVKPKLLSKGKRSEVSNSYNLINQGNRTLGHSSLIKQLTTKDIVIANTGSVDNENAAKSLEELFIPFYSDERLMVRKLTAISDEELQVQTEITSEAIKAAIGGGGGDDDGKNRVVSDTIKAVISLRNKNNVLYVNSVKIIGQPEFVGILNKYVQDEDISLKALLILIDEQIAMRWMPEENESVEKVDLCELVLQDGIDVYECDDSSVTLYKDNIEYQFVLSDGVLQSYTIDDSVIQEEVSRQLAMIQIAQENTPDIIVSILSFKVSEDGEPVQIHFEQKSQLINQFRIHFRMVPDEIIDIDGKDNEFTIKFTIGEFDLEARYNIDTHIISNISYVSGCGKTLGIRGLTIEVSAENENQLSEILNNPRGFFPKANASAYKKYQRLCEDEK